jgi:hypothetical protein
MSCDTSRLAPRQRGRRIPISGMVVTNTRGENVVDLMAALRLSMDGATAQPPG